MNKASMFSSNRRYVSAARTVSTMAAREFWRPIAMSAGISAAVLLVCGLLLRTDLDSTGFGMSQLMSLEYPNADRSPQDVVRLQMEGMTNRQDPILGVFQCYCFASPANRIATGPFQRFYQLVRTPPYDCLSSCESYCIGESQEVDGVARVLVTTIGDQDLRAFVFILERQTESPFEQCWMTSGVFPLMENGEAIEAGPVVDI